MYGSRAVWTFTKNFLGSMNILVMVNLIEFLFSTYMIRNFVFSGGLTSLKGIGSGNYLNRKYLNCFIFEVTPIFKKQDEAGFCELSISVVSVQKSPMNSNFQILEGMLMLVSYFHSISLFMPCQIFFVLFIYYFLVMKLIVVKDIFGL